MVQPTEHVVYAIHDYEIPEKGFLPLRAGDIVHVVDADASGWWLGVNLRREKGVFPSTYTLPYVFPLPPADLLHDAHLLLLGREFQVDVASGAPIPLVGLTIQSPPVGPSLPSAEYLREELQRLLLERERTRRAVLDHLANLLGARERKRVVLQVAAEAQKSQEQQREMEKLRIRSATAHLQSAMESLEKRKQSVLASRTSPPPWWYEQLANVGVAVAAPLGDAVEAASSREAVWRAAVKDVKGVVRRQEKELSALSSSCAEKERAFTDAAAALQKRIEWRDLNVAALLAYWADVATRTKSNYISCKTERDAAEVTHQQEGAQLRRRLEEGKERFAAAKEAYRGVKREAQAISDMLKQQNTLKTLLTEVAQLDREIATREVK